MADQPRWQPVVKSIMTARTQASWFERSARVRQSYKRVLFDQGTMAIMNFAIEQGDLAVEQNGEEGEEHRWLCVMKAGQRAGEDSRCASSWFS